MALTKSVTSSTNGRTRLVAKLLNWANPSFIPSIFCKKIDSNCLVTNTKLTKQIKSDATFLQIRWPVTSRQQVNLGKYHQSFSKNAQSDETQLIASNNASSVWLTIQVKIDALVNQWFKLYVFHGIVFVIRDLWEKKRRKLESGKKSFLLKRNKTLDLTQPCIYWHWQSDFIFQQAEMSPYSSSMTQQMQG